MLSHGGRAADGWWTADGQRMDARRTADGPLRAGDGRGSVDGGRTGSVRQTDGGRTAHRQPMAGGQTTNCGQTAEGRRTADGFVPAALPFFVRRQLANIAHMHGRHMMYLYVCLMNRKAQPRVSVTEGENAMPSTPWLVLLEMSAVNCCVSISLHG